MSHSSVSTVTVRLHLLTASCLVQISSLSSVGDSFFSPFSFLCICLWLYQSVLYNSGHWFIMTSLENARTHNCSSEATTKHIMQSLFSDRIPVPVLSSMDKVSSVAQPWEVAHIISVPSRFYAHARPKNILSVVFSFLRGSLKTADQITVHPV